MAIDALYVFEKGAPADAGRIATTRGWFDFGTLIENNAAQFPALAELIEEGGAALDGLADELDRLLQAEIPPALQGIIEQLLAALRDAPSGAVALMMTDGEAGG
jgi:hypothetical protein